MPLHWKQDSTLFANSCNFGEINKFGESCAGKTNSFQVNLCLHYLVCDPKSWNHFDFLGNLWNLVDEIMTETQNDFLSIF